MLYNLPEVMAADVVLFAEGEKKADILARFKLQDSRGKPVAVTTTGGADSWRFEHAKYLTGKRIVFLPDADEPGCRYRESVEASLKRVGIEYTTASFDEFGNDFRAFLETSSIEDLVGFIGCPWLAIPQVETEIQF